MFFAICWCALVIGCCAVCHFLDGSLDFAALAARVSVATIPRRDGASVISPVSTKLAATLAFNQPWLGTAAVFFTVDNINIATSAKRAWQ